jgi:hypothetical protein
MLALALLLAAHSVGTESKPTKAAFEPLVAAAPRAPALAVPQDEAASPALSYSFLEIGATRLDLDAIDDEADSYYGRVSLGLLGFLYVFGGYENQSVDFDNTDTDVWSLGVGGHFDFSQDLSAFGDVAWLYNEIDSDTFDDSSSGALVRIGGRWMALRFAGNAGLEVNGAGLWYSLDDSLLSDDDSAGFEAGLRVHFIDFLSIGATYTVVEDDDAAALNARFSF